jgi:RNA polymerase sigma-70 factor (ECF subfamily)
MRSTEPIDWQSVSTVCHGHARRVLRNHEDAEDAAQDALLRAWRRRDRLQDADEQLAWTRRVAHNEALRTYRRANARGQQRYADPPERAGVAEPFTDAVVDRVVVAQLLAGTAARDRTLLHLRYGEDLTHQQIAARLGMPVGTVKVRLHRARKVLLERLTAS